MRQKGTLRRRLRSAWRITWAVAAKDIVDAFKNKILLGVMMGVLMMMASGRMLPLLSGMSNAKILVVYDRGQSRSILKLRKVAGVRLQSVSSLHALQEAVGTASEMRLGVVVPAGFDQAVAEEGCLSLTGYAVHWAAEDRVEARRAFFEEAMAQAVGHAVRIAIDEERVYPPPDGAGATGAASTAIVLAVMTVGIFMVPYLIIDERQAKTLDALLISPATVWQIVAGKALAGSVYSLLVVVTAAAFHHSFVVHWGAAALVVLCGAFFAVGAGVLLGSLFALSQHVNALGGLLLVVLTIAMYLADRTARLPGAVSAALPHLPSVALNHALKLTFAEVVSGVALWVQLAKVLAVSAVVYGLAVWRIKRSDR